MWGMGGNQQLGALAGRPEFLGQFGQQIGVEEILRFFDADEGRGGGVEHQHQIGQHLQRAVGREARLNWFIEGPVLDLQ